MNRLVRTCVLFAWSLASSACQSQEAQVSRQSGSEQCRTAFLSLVHDGRIESVNGLSLDADWKTAYVTIRTGGDESNRTAIGEYRCNESGWTGPHAAMAEHAYKDYQPVLSPGGNLLLFTSTRPLETNASVEARQNVWYARRTAEGGWRPVGPVEGLESRFWDGHAVLTRNGHLYFASEREGGKGMVDIYRADWDHPDVDEKQLEKIEFSGATDNVMNVDRLNSEASDNDLYVTPDESLIVFSRYDPDNRDIDLFYSTREGDSDWSTPMPFTTLNTPQWELSPTITPDREWLLYHSAGKSRYVAVRLADHMQPRPANGAAR